MRMQADQGSISSPTAQIRWQMSNICGVRLYATCRSSLPLCMIMQAWKVSRSCEMLSTLLAGAISLCAVEAVPNSAFTLLIAAAAPPVTAWLCSPFEGSKSVLTCMIAYEPVQPHVIWAARSEDLEMF